MNEYVTRKSELYLKASQSLQRVRPHYDNSGLQSYSWPGETQMSRRSSWASEPGVPEASEADAADPAAQTTTGGSATDSRWSSGRPWTWQSWYNDGSWHGYTYSQKKAAGKSEVPLLPEWVQGWYLLQDANLSTNEKNGGVKALRGDYSVDKVAQELRTQWPEAELKRRDQSYRATSFMGSHLEDDSEAEEAGDEDFDPQDLNEDSASREVETAWAT